MLSALHLAKSYQSREVVKDVSLAVRSGEIVGLVPIDSGTIHLGGHEITHLSVEHRARMGLGYLPQEASVFRKLTVEENILAVLETLPGLSPAHQSQRLENLLREFHLSHIKGNLGTNLSGGERRRTEIARALATEPRFILLDEPFAGVDPISVLDIQRIIKHLASLKIGILITDHNVRETLGICDRAYIVNDGTIIASGAPEAILENQHVREVYLG